MSDQDAVVSGYQNVVSTSADQLREEVFSYITALGTILFEIPALDGAHRDQIIATDKSALIKLRARLESLLGVIREALQAGYF